MVLSSRFPAPYPVFSTIISGIFSNESAREVIIAAPVGVTSSYGISVPYTGVPFRIESVAGAGTGSVPWRQETNPFPNGSLIGQYQFWENEAATDSEAEEIRVIYQNAFDGIFPSTGDGGYTSNTVLLF